MILIFIGLSLLPIGAYLYSDSKYSNKKEIFESKEMLEKEYIDTSEIISKRRIKSVFFYIIKLKNKDIIYFSTRKNIEAQLIETVIIYKKHQPLFFNKQPISIRKMSIKSNDQSIIIK